MMTALCFGFAASAQLEQVVLEVFDPAVDAGVSATPYGLGYVPVDPNLVTYRLYAEFTPGTDTRMSAVFATQDCHLLDISTTTGFWNQSGFGANRGSAISCAFFALSPDIAGDSWVTIGADCASQPGTGDVNAIASETGVGAYDAYTPCFGTNPGISLELVDGAIFTLNTSATALPSGPNNRVLLGQFTTDGEISYHINMQIFADITPGWVGPLDPFRQDYVWSVDCQQSGPTTAQTGFEVDGSAIGLIWPIPSNDGCTDPLACNYDETAVNDDGSCEYNVVLDMTDDFGDGWNGATYTITDNTDALNPVVVATGDLDNASTGDGSSIGSDSFCLADGCYNLTIGGGTFDGEIGYTLSGVDGGPISGFGAVDLNFSINTAVCDIPGCTDINACNYNVDATLDDGSCFFAPVEDECANAIDLGDVSTSVVGSNVNACVDTEVGEQAGVFYSFTLTANAIVSIETSSTGVDMDTQLALFANCGDASTIAFNDDGGTGFYSLLTFANCGDLAPGSYIIMVDGFGGEEGDFNLDLNIDYASCVVVFGCTDEAACNYDPSATDDDGSCILPAANDVCANATDLGSATTSVVVDNTAACTAEDPAISIPGTGCNTNDGWCAGNTVEDAGVWYSFTMPANDADVSIVTSDDGVAGLTDTQIAVFDGCGGNLVGANDDGNGLYGALSFDCGVLTPGATYLILVDQYSALSTSGTCNLDITIDEAACVVTPCDDTEVELVVDGGGFPSEVTFDIIDGASNIVYSGTGADGTVNLCLVDGCYTVDMFDSFGDGWNGASLTFSVGGSVVAVIDLDSAPIGNGDDLGTDFVDIGATGTCPVIGCTDPTACNYDDTATIDDGSCIAAPCVNDLPSLAIALPVDPFGSCTGLVGEDMDAATITAPEATFGSLGAGNDLWYSFVAPSPGIRIEVATGDFDAMIELQDAGNGVVETEDVVFVNGGEVLNIGNLTAGETYFVRVFPWLDTTGPALFDICVSSIPSTTCDYGFGPYSLCNTYKADWVSADDYIFEFTSQTTSDVYTYQQGFANTFVQLFNVPGLQWGDDYDVAISAVFNLTDGSGSTEEVVVETNAACAIGVNDQPLAALRESDNEANFGPHFLGNYVAATPWVCGAVDWTWEFVNTDGSELPIIHSRGAANRFLQLSDVAGLQNGAVYEVRVKPEFANGSMTMYGGTELLSIIGAAGMQAEIDSPVAITDDAERDLFENLGDVAIYPNPNRGDYVNVNINNIADGVDRVLIDIYDSFGKLVMSNQYAPNGSNLNMIMTLDGMASGLYTVNIIVDGEVRTERMLIQR